MSEEIPQTRVCRKCDATFIPTRHQVNIGSLECHECKRTRERDYRARRKAAGKPVPNYPQSAEARKALYRSKCRDPEYRARLNDKQRQKYQDPEYRHKVKVRRETNRAIERGEMHRLPCETCGFEPAEAHHPDYSQPSAVMWLCKPHHEEWHKQHDGGANG